MKKTLIVFVPNKINAHPYLLQLYSSLEKYGVSVLYIKSKSLLTLFRDILKANILHLHWIEYYFKSRRLLLALTKLLSFIALLLLLKKLFLKKIIITLHNVIPHEPSFPSIEYKGFLISMKLSNHLIVHNKYSKRMAQKLYGVNEERISVIPHGNFIEYYKEISKAVSREKAREILKIPKESIVFTFFGILRKYKGVDILLKAIEEPLKKHRNAILIISGRANKTYSRKIKRLQKEFPKKIYAFLDYIPDKYVPVILKASDVGIIPYRRIWTSGVVMLYLSFGVPLITTYLPPIVELLGDNAIYFERENVNDLKRAIEYAVENINSLREKRSYLVSIARKFNWELIARKTLKLYLQLILE